MLSSGIGASDGPTFGGDAGSARFAPTTLPAEASLTPILAEPDSTVCPAPRLVAVPPIVHEQADPSSVIARRWDPRADRLLCAGIDLGSGVVAAAAAYFLHRTAWGGKIPTPSLPLVLSAPAVWLAYLAAHGGCDSRCRGMGHADVSRIFRAFLHLCALLAVVAYLTDADVPRTFVLLLLPLTLALDLAARGAIGAWGKSRRHASGRIRSVLAVGDPSAVAWFATTVKCDSRSRIAVLGACLWDDSGGEATELADVGVPCLGTIDSIREHARSLGVDTVVVVSSSRSGSEQLRSLAWRLEGSGIDLLVSPGLLEVSGRRLHIESAGWMSFLAVEQPEFHGMRRLLKGAFDRVVALVALLVLLPVFAVLYAAIRLTSPGPAIFGQIRIGRDGKPFKMFKFRSMHVDAESRLTALQSLNLHKSGPLFKLRDDPRVTRIGRTLRRYSLDELPQLVNVLLGQMSLVGPRPPLPNEVLAYGPEARRRLLVKPGLTGLWQVSGRSDLDWTESLRLDLRYVENWSPALDLAILWRTASAVLRGTGAY